MPQSADFAPFELESGQGMRFNGNECRHFTKPNTTGHTRVSIDFRVIPTSLAVFAPGHYKSRKGKIGDYDVEVTTDALDSYASP